MKTAVVSLVHSKRAGTSVLTCRRHSPPCALHRIRTMCFQKGPTSATGPQRSGTRQNAVTCLITSNVIPSASHTWPCQCLFRGKTTLAGGTMIMKRG
jgi:hypothetical protein